MRARVTGRHLNDAGRRISAEQCALRSLQDGNLAHIRQAGRRHELRAVIDAVNVETNRIFNRRAEEGGADAAKVRRDIAERKSVVSGQSVSVSVVIGGRRILKNKKTQKQPY